jgi:hypothetical protein
MYYILVSLNPNPKNMYYILVSADEQALRDSSGLEDTSICGMIEHEANWISQSGVGVHDVFELPTDDDQELVDKVIEEIKRDVYSGDLTAIDELLKFIPVQYLKGYLPE